MAEIVNMRVGKNLQGLKDFVEYIKQFYNTKELTLLEIGSFKGESSEIFAENFKKVTCVDNWIGASVEMYLNTCTVKDIEDAFDERMKRFDNVKKMKTTSKEFAESSKIKYDIIYIDAAHDYDNVKQDILLWKDRARIMITGHDYNKNHKGVIRAVNEIYTKIDKLFQDSTWIMWTDRIKYSFIKIREKWDGKQIPYEHTNYEERKDDIYKQIVEGYDFEGKTIIDFGCGAGHLGKYLFENFNIKKYIGIDTSKVSINFAKERLRNYDNKELILMDEFFDFSKYEADIFISIFCIRYFPDRLYLDEFLKKVNESKCKDLIIQYRMNRKNTLDFISEKVMTFVCYIPKDWIGKVLPNYSQSKSFISNYGGMIEDNTYWKIK